MTRINPINPSLEEAAQSESQAATSREQDRESERKIDPGQFQEDWSQHPSERGEDVEATWRRAQAAIYGPASHREGGMARTIEHQTARLPSDTFLWAAGGCIAASLTLKMMGRDTDALFVGQWAPTILILGVYNKIVKVAGSEDRDAGFRRPGMY